MVAEARAHRLVEMREEPGLGAGENVWWGWGVGA